MSRKNQPLPHEQGDPWAKVDVREQARKRAMERLDEREHFDAYVNALTGIGDWTKDKTFGGLQGGLEFALVPVVSVAAEARWRGSDLGARIVETIPDEMTREGIDVVVQPGENEGKGKEAEIDEETEKLDTFPNQQPPLMAPPKEAPKPIEVDDESTEIAELIEGELEQLAAMDVFWQALCYERAYGGGAILLGIDDGEEDLSKPLDEDNVSKINWLTAFQGGFDGEIVAWSYYNDPRQKRYGQPEIYMIRNLGVPIAKIPAPGQSINLPKAQMSASASLVFWVHESRLLVFNGSPASRRAQVQMRGWGDSLFTRVDKVLADYNQTWGGVAHMMTEFSQGVLNVEGLKQALAGGNKSSRGNPITTRARQIQMTKSIARLMILDKDEAFTRVTATVSGVADVLQQFSLRLAAASDMPVDLLMGQGAAGGLNKGDTTIRFFYDRIESRRKKRLLPQLKRLVTLIMKSKEGPLDGKEPERWTLNARALYQLTELERADLRQKQANTDHIYVQDGVVTPEEIAASRFGGSDYSTETTIDFEGRQKQADLDEKDKAEKQKLMSEAAKKGVQPTDLSLTHPEHPLNLPAPASQKEGDKKDAEEPGTGVEQAPGDKWPFGLRPAEEKTDDFNEELHPRDERGRFGEGGGAGGHEVHLTAAISSGGKHVTVAAPIHRGPGPIFARHEAEKFTEGSAFTGAFYRGTSHPESGAFIPPTSSTMSLMGRGIYMVQKPETVQAEKYGQKQELRINVRNPIDQYGKEAKELKTSPNFKHALEKVSGKTGGNWQTEHAAAFQAVAQSRGYDAVYYKADDGQLVVCAWNASKVAVVKGDKLDWHTDDWNEEDHPRDERGRFGEGGGGAKGDLLKGSLGIPRSAMPQIKSEHQALFRQHLNNHGISTHTSYARVGDLKATQGELNMAKVQTMRGAVKPGEKPILVSSDNHVIDGHHRWAGMKLSDPNQIVPVVRISAPIHQALAVARAFDKAETGHSVQEIAKAQAAGAVQAPLPKVDKWIDHFDHLPKETWMVTMTGNPDTDPHAAPQPWRAPLHEEIKHAALDHVQPVPRDEHKIAIMTMGGPASGKSTLVSKMGIDPSKFVMVDPDGVKEMLPEYQAATGRTWQKGDGPRVAATDSARMAHEESSYLGKQIRDQAIKDGKNLVIDGTGANGPKFVDQVRRLQAQGYKVHLVYSDLTVEAGIPRMLERAQKNGRIVPVEFATPAYSTIAKNFQTISKAVDSFDVYNASGSKTELAWSRGADGAETLHSESFVTGFKQQHYKGE